ncbi:MAG: DUF2490 domain-containing protein [Spirosomaceae bacterium]|nr:DUF2490 domain-containing protein [Spirosomataceae bacterium]
MTDTNIFKYFLLLFIPCFANAQEFNDLGTWNILNVRYQVDKRWTLTGEGQLRSLSFYKQFHYYEFKGSVGYKVSDQISVLMGAGSYQTYREGGNFVEPKINDEFRMWSQVSLNNSWQRLKLEHRYRWENRWTLRGYRNRFRYRLQAQLPLNRPKIQAKTWYAVASNELFLTDKATYFERNRFFAGMGYEFNSHVAMQGGWLRQFDYFVNDEIGRNFFQISLQLRFKSKKASYTAPPPTE